MEIIKTVRKTTERWINLFSRTYRHKGHEGEWVFVSRKADPEVPAAGFDAVVIVPLLQSAAGPPRLVVLKEYRIPIGDYVYAFPAGLVEEGENVEEVARRELKEETGFEVIEVRKVSPVLYSSAGLTDESSVLAFVTARATPDGKPRLEKSEEIEVQLLDYAQVCALCDSGARIDAKAWAVLYLYQQLGRLF
jgi:ADP-ribose pyrophosphatase